MSKIITNKYKEELKDALNRMDELIEELGGTLEERKQQGKDYNLLFDFIQKTL